MSFTGSVGPLILPKIEYLIMGLSQLYISEDCICVGDFGLLALKASLYFLMGIAYWQHKMQGFKGDRKSHLAINGYYICSLYYKTPYIRQVGFVSGYLTYLSPGY